MKVQITIILSCLLLIAPNSIKATKIEVIYKNHLPEIEGRSVLAVFRDSKGFLWIGTYKGLLKYDGCEYIEFTEKSEHKKALSSSTVYSIYEDSNNRLWIGTQNGLNEYHYSTNTISQYLTDSKNPHNYKEIRDITEDHDGNLWLASYNNQGVIKYTPKTKKDSTFKIPNINDLRINTIEYTNNKLWIGAELNGLFCFDLQSGRISNPVNYDETGTLLTVNDIKIKNNILWMGTWYNGLVKYDILNKKTTWLNGANSKVKIPESNNVRQIAIDNKNNLWLAIFGGVVTKYNPQTDAFTSIKSKFDYNISSEILSSWAICIDKQNIIWLGLFDKGLKSLYMNAIQSDFLTFELQNYKYNIRYINKAVQDNDKNIWIATQTQGLIKYDIENKTGTPIRLSNNIAIKTIEIDKLNRIWASTENGIYIINSSTNEILINLAQTNTFFNDSIKTPSIIYSDNDGDIWLAAWQTGLTRIPFNEVKNSLNNLKYELYRADSSKNNGLFNNTLINIYQTSKGTLLVSGTYFIQSFDKKLKHFNLFEWIDGEDIAEDCNDHLWIFSNSKGIVKYNVKNKEYRLMGVEDQTYSRIAGTFKHNCSIYFTRLNDLIKFNSSENKFSFINVDAGIKNIHHNNSCFTLNDTTIFMGGEEGCYILNSIRPPESYSEVRISNLFIFNKPINAFDSIHNKVIITKDIGNLPDITIPPHIQSFSIELSSINFTNPEDVVYAYKLIGLDTSWHYLRNPNRIVVFNNLKGGDYQFEFALYNPFNEWENNSKAVNIKVLIPFYKTILFKVLISLMVISIILIYFLIRQRQLKKLNKELEIKVSNRTEQLKLSNIQLKEMNIAKDKFFSIIAHDLRSPIGSIKGLLSLLDMNFEKMDIANQKKHIKLASDSSKTVHNLVENLLLWSRAISHKIDFHPQYTEIDTLISENIKLANLSAREKNIEIHYTNESKSDKFHVDRNMFKFIIRNLVSNAVKFTPNNGKVNVHFIENNKGIEVCVADNGIGINSVSMDNIFKIDKQAITYGTNNEKGTGLGLILCKDFIEKHGGKIWIDSEVDKGSTFYFSIPQPLQHKQYN